MIMRLMCPDRRPIDPAAGVRGRHSTAEWASPSAGSQIAAFLDGKTNGQDLLHALYDYVLEEPIPPSMSAILHR